MGSRGKIAEDKTISERWNWLDDVSDERLRAYIKRADYLEDKKDPQGRDIHSVGYYARKVLEKRGKI
jgi:hypothetical protein